MTYNGWTNYETWSVALLLDNDEGSQDYWRDRAEELDTYELGQELKDEHDEGNPLTGNCDVFDQLLSAALSEVNWYEVAEHISETV